MNSISTFYRHFITLHIQPIALNIEDNVLLGMLQYTIKQNTSRHNAAQQEGPVIVSVTI